MIQEQHSMSVEKGAYVSIIAYLFLSALKLIVGYFGHSKGLWADGLNNATDIIASIAVLIGLKISKRPPDEDHLYGHLRAETIASLVSAFIMATVGLQVIMDAIKSFFVQETEAISMLSAYTALFSALFMYGVYRYNLSLSKQANSAAMRAVAQDNRSDALVSIGALVGIMGAKIGLGWLDGVAALLVGFVICKTAWDIFMESSHSLTDGFDEELLQDISETISKTGGVRQLTEIKARMHGNRILLEATILVNPLLTVTQSHEITVEVEKTLLENHDIRHAIIHIEPEIVPTKNNHLP